MRRPIIFLASALTALCIILSATVPALAAEDLQRDVRTGTMIIALNEYAIIGEFTTDQSQSLTPEISYNVFIFGDDGPVYYDILLMDESNFTKYKNNETFAYITEGSRTAQTGESVSISKLPLAQHTKFFLVADNTDLPTGAPISSQELRIGYILIGYNVTLQSPSENIFTLALIAIVVIVLLIVLVLVLLFLIMRKKNVNRRPVADQAVIQPAIQENGKSLCPVCRNPVGPVFLSCPYCGNRLK